MIDYKEIRYGNWIIWKSGSELPCQVALDDFELVFNNPEQYDPIPITEEWLMKFGFQKSGNYNFEYNQHSCWKDGTNKQWYFVWYFQRDKFYKSVQYIHQIQNLYFALTGVEFNVVTEPAT